MQIPNELLDVLNPEGKRLTTSQWKNAYQKYLDLQNKKKSQNEGNPDSRPGVCKCGHSSFKLEVIFGTGGKIRRTCKSCNDEIII